jgi:putative ABC transport system substrate-binding protein
MTRPFASLKPFLLPLLLIALVGALLLALDDSGTKSAAGMPRVAIVQHASQAALDEGVRGIVKGLASQGFIDGRTVKLKFYNAQGDVPTANDIARQVTNGSADLVITSSTLSMQAVANANRQSKVRHVFGIVTSAASAGIGVSATDPLDHPAHLTGYTSLVPVIDALKLAREFNPGLKRVGLVWHSAEVSSQMYTAEARKACKELGIELLEATAESSIEVGQAAQSLASRGIDAFLLTGDVVVLMAADSLVKAARNERIPVLSLIPPNFRKGTLFDLGADYDAVGRDVGLLAATVLAGTSPATLPVVNKVPLTFNLNLSALQGLREAWQLPATVLERAHLVIDKDGERRQKPRAVTP